MSAAERDRHRAGLDLAAIWPWLVFPILPLLIGLALLNVLYDPALTFAGSVAPRADDSTARFAASFVEAANRSFMQFEGLTVYAAVALFHVGLCVFALIYFIAQIRSFPDRIEKRAWRLAGLLLTALLVAGVIARFDATALQLTYRNTCELLRAADAAVHLLPDECHEPSPSPLLLLASVPTLAGLIAAVFAAAMTSCVVGGLPENSESAWRAAFAERARTLQHAFYATSAVLITSTVTIMLFLQLPLAIEADDATQAAVASFARGMTVFWGGVFTLTLLAIFAPSVWHLLSVARRYEMTSVTPSDVRTWFTEQIQASIPARLGNIAALLAPLLVGPVGALLEKLAEAG